MTYFYHFQIRRETSEKWNNVSFFSLPLSNLTLNLLVTFIIPRNKIIPDGGQKKTLKNLKMISKSWKEIQILSSKH